MISKELVRKAVDEAIAGTNIFVVDVTVGGKSKIFVSIDTPEGISINECKSVSKYVESQFDREEEDFELTVSSPGLEKPFKVFEQYLKNVGRNVEVDLMDGKSIKGTLKQADKDGILIESVSKEKNEKTKKKEEVVKQFQIETKTIKQTKVVISFK